MLCFLDRISLTDNKMLDKDIQQTWLRLAALGVDVKNIGLYFEMNRVLD